MTTKLHEVSVGVNRIGMITMTPKEQYQARRAERNKLKDMDSQVRQRTETLMMMDMLDRFVTAVERIADSLTQTSGQ